MFSKKPLLISIAGLLASGPVFALQPASLGSSGESWTPTLGVSLVHDDNIRATSEGESALIKTVNPKLFMRMDTGKSMFDAQLSVTRRYYSADAIPSFTDYSFSSVSALMFDVRNRVDFGYNLSKTTSAAGATVIGNVDTFKNQNLFANYKYGAPSATGNIVAGINFNKYDALQAVNNRLNRESSTASLEFSVKGAGQSRVLAEVIAVKNDYVTADDKDSNNYIGRVGIRWDATAKTTGEVKVGYEEKQFDASGVDDSNLVNWKASIQWQPKTYSTFTLSTSQRIDEASTLDSNAIDSSDVSLGWAHDWGNKVSTNLNLSYFHKDYLDSTRVDKARNASLQMTYEFRRWFDIALGYNFTKQDSTYADYDYDRNQYTLTFVMSL
ncbi:outer membrane beta-barrel protein [Thiomicrorhabdus sp. 6S2-11]|uniref:Outer membrane beta-barrel protein n=1 Tax=Thiomicrorhabdus marina TaxID=2818442 RepID=A0ABS3Q2G9_9GAMM|nr:outer membrane beta-barrel protein [Thiomicrorhabdus marina]MBO1926358.1 outer membrane beta-barrel protein [Thiomicrorhabdus marina]